MIQYYRRRSEKEEETVSRVHNNSYELVKFVLALIVDTTLKTALLCLAWFAVNSIGSLINYHVPAMVLIFLVASTPVAMALTLDELLFRLSKLE